MAQVYKMMLGTSGRQWELLTVRDNGTMMLYFHGTDRSVTQQVTAVTEGAWKGWLRSEGGSLYTGIESGKWRAVDCPAESAEIAESEQRTDTDGTDVATAEPQEHTGTVPAVSSDDAVARITEGLSPACSIAHEGETTINPAPLIVNQAKPARPRRQRKARKPRVERQEPLNIEHSPLNIEHQPSTISPQTSSTLKAVGMVAAATVALLVIYETGLLIPLGLIGLATGGILK